MPGNLAPLSLVLLPLVLAACNRRPPADPAFAAEWKAWHDRREERLRTPTGWLALTGLHWLERGENRLPGLPGTFTLEGGKVTLAAARSDGYALGGAPLERRALAPDSAGEPDRVQLGASVTLAVIERSGRFAVRVWDAAAPARTGFRGVDAYPADPRWRIEARWEAYPAPREVEVPSVIGVATRELAPGRAHFTVEGREVALEPTAEEDGGLFFVFKDATARDATYGAGRFLSAAAPRDGKVVLDFNRAVNPPCAFSAFATCPLPTPENVLPIRIEAGEKRYGAH
ncbi:DUF1684 domain-containing protein [Anaeromyxobacter sp. Red801]|uniref:DUF1684 domain-containing protein n=1 Tax=Anaeromyxobacter sp. Red801 TaxID=3411632 RepID=UPI003B9F96E4